MAPPSASEGGVSVALLAKLFDLTPRRVQQLAKDGVIPKPQRGQYSLPGAVHGYVKFLRERLEEKQANDLNAVTPELQGQRQRKARLEADLLELQLAQARRETCTVAEFDATLLAIAERLNARLDAFPSRVAPMAHTAASQGTHAIQAVLEDHVQELKAELRAVGHDEPLTAAA